MSETQQKVDPAQKCIDKGVGKFLLPSPIPTRRTRTTSVSKLASDSPQQTGVCKEFCRDKGHGFIIPNDGGANIFVHISDVQGELVLKASDEVMYRTCPLPPKCTEKQAVEVMIIHAENNAPHDTWSALSNSTMSSIPRSSMSPPHSHCKSHHI